MRQLEHYQHYPLLSQLYCCGTHFYPPNKFLEYTNLQFSNTQNQFAQKKPLISDRLLQPFKVVPLGQCELVRIDC